jgi:coenzyme F420-reducing hydrogenase alpha subunit
MKRISKHISYKEAVGSNYAKQKGIKNKPNEEQVENMKLLAKEVFEPLREWVDAPIKVNSMFRSLELNTALKGSKTSSHMKGEAMDITSMGGKSNLEMFHYIKDNLEFDQLIWEFGSEPKWLHVSYNKDNNRKQVLVTKKRGVYYTY